MHLYRTSLLCFSSLIVGIIALFGTPERTVAQQTQPQAQRLVESVDITGNRRLRKDDILYYVQTRAGDPYNEAQVQRDYQTLLSLTFFDKTKTRVLTETGPRGGVNVIFEVSELPIIRDLTFDGLKSVAESDVLKAFRWTYIPDEMFFATVLISFLNEPNIVNSHLRFIEYFDLPRDYFRLKIVNRNGIRNLGPADLDKLRSSTALFARKFDPLADPGILDRLDDMYRA